MHLGAVWGGVMTKGRTAEEKGVISSIASETLLNKKCPESL